MKNTWSRRARLLALTISILVPVVAYGASLLYQAAPPVIKWKKSAVQEITLTSNVTLSFQGGKVGERYTLVVLQDASGGRTITWPTEVQWPGGTTPALTSAPNSTDVFEFLFDGARYLGSVTKDFKAPPSTLGLNAGLIHYWKLDELSGDAMDSVGSMTMTNVNSTQFAPGKINNGTDFEESNSNYLESDTDLVASPLTSYSMCSWVKPESDPASGIGGRIWATYDTPGSFDLLYVNFGGLDLNLRFNQYDTPEGPTNPITYPISLNSDVFYHLCTTWDGTSIRLYVDGTQVGSASATTIRTNVEENGTAMGGQPLPSGVTVPNSPFDGIIDEVGFWDRALSAAEISELYNGGVGRSYPF